MLQHAHTPGCTFLSTQGLQQLSAGLILSMHYSRQDNAPSCSDCAWLSAAPSIHPNLQRFSAGNLHVTPCPVTRSIHLSRVNMTIGDGGELEEIVEEELPQVHCRVIFPRCAVKSHLLMPNCRLVSSARLLKSLPKLVPVTARPLGCTGLSCRFDPMQCTPLSQHSLSC
jgi:hypothetical protein